MPLVPPCPDLAPFRRRAAFTLIELLIVITIIGVLSGILLSVMSTVQERANRTTCLNNLHQIGTAALGYESDNNGSLPGPCDSGLKMFYTSNQLTAVLAPYIGLPSSPTNRLVPLFQCPTWKQKIVSTINPNTINSSTNIICYVSDNEVVISGGATVQVNGYPASGTTAAKPPSKAALLASLEGQDAQTGHGRRRGPGRLDHPSDVLDDGHYVHHGMRPGELGLRFHRRLVRCPAQNAGTRQHPQHPLLRHARGSPVREFDSLNAVRPAAKFSAGGGARAAGGGLRPPAGRHHAAPILPVGVGQPAGVGTGDHRRFLARQPRRACRDPAHLAEPLPGENPGDDSRWHRASIIMVEMRSYSGKGRLLSCGSPDRGWNRTMRWLTVGFFRVARPAGDFADR